MDHHKQLRVVKRKVLTNNHKDLVWVATFEDGSEVVCSVTRNVEKFWRNSEDPTV